MLVTMRAAGISQLIRQQHKALMMSNRDFDRRYDYSCRCGWIDWAHADIGQHTPLIEQVEKEASKNPVENNLNYFLEGDPAFIIHYGFQSGKGLKFERNWVIKKGLSSQEKNSVALAIFEAAGQELEEWQGTFIPKDIVRSSSSFSVEDLTSNKLAFYMALRKFTPEDVRSKCGVISRDKAYDVWVYMNKNFGGLGQLKNKESTPVYFPCEDCKGEPIGMPHEFDSIRPAEHGRLWVKPTQYVGATLVRSGKDVHFRSSGSFKAVPAIPKKK